MDPEQQQRFERAVEDKKAEAEARSRQQPAQTPAPELPEQQRSRIDTAHQQDDFSVRDKNTRHKKVTADKWNQ